MNTIAGENIESPTKYIHTIYIPTTPYIYPNDIQNKSYIEQTIKPNNSDYLRNCALIIIIFLSILGLLWAIIRCYYYFFTN